MRMKKIFPLSRIFMCTIALAFSLPGAQNSAGERLPFATWKGYTSQDFQVKKLLEVNPEGDWEGTVNAGAGATADVLFANDSNGGSWDLPTAVWIRTRGPSSD